jgi:hypothetical protein
MLKIELPKTEEELLKLMKMAFKEGQKYTKGKIEYSYYDDVDDELYSKPTLGFEEWANQKWKYGLVQLQVLNNLP